MSIPTPLQPSDSPDIVLSNEDHDRLSRLALAGSGPASPVAEALLRELDRAKIVPSGNLPSDVVCMGSTVRYRTDEGEQREVTLVFPGEADIDRGLVSVMTPIGAALIGLSRGQSIIWSTRDGRQQTLTALRVMQPHEEPTPPTAA